MVVVELRNVRSVHQSVVPVMVHQIKIVFHVLLHSFVVVMPVLVIVLMVTSHRVMDVMLVHLDVRDVIRINIIVQNVEEIGRILLYVIVMMDTMMMELMIVVKVLFLFNIILECVSPCLTCSSSTFCLTCPLNKSPPNCICLRNAPV